MKPTQAGPVRRWVSSRGIGGITPSHDPCDLPSLLSSKTSGTISRMTPRGGGGVLGSGFAVYVQLASQSPHPIIIYSVANYRPHLSHF